MLVWYVLSIAFPLSILGFKKVNILSPAYILLAFNTLYSMVIILGSHLNYDRLPLLGEEDLTIIHTYISISVNIALGLAYLVFFKKNKYVQNFKIKYNWNLFIIIYIGIFLFLTINGKRYGWDAVSHGLAHGGLASLYFYIRIFFAAMLIYYFINNKKITKLFYILVLLQIIVTIIDGGRTTIIPTFACMIYIFIERNGFKTIYFIFLVLVILLMLLTRALIMKSDSIFSNMISSILIEGAFGSYSSLNVLNLILHGDIKNYTFGLSYIYDPIIWSIPFANTQMTFFKQFISENFQNINFTPMGGFYFVAEANAAIPIVGPFLIVLIIFSCFAILERKHNKESLFFIAMYVSVGFLFAKIIFGNAIKIFVIYFTSLIIINFFVKLRIRIKK